MIELKFTSASADELQTSIERILRMLNGATETERAVETVQAAPSLALYNNDELAEELARRQDDVKTDTPTEPKKPGRPRKIQSVAPPPKPTTEAVEQQAEPQPDPAATAVAKPVEPTQAAGTVTGNLPTVDQMLKLMTTVYSKCGDIQLVRSIAEEVCGKVNLADCAPDKFPELKRRLDAKLAELSGAVA